VSGNFFTLLGVHAFIGREFTEDEVRVPGSAPVIEISHGFWERAFGQNPGAVGEKLVVNGFAFTIIGVMPPEFSGDIIGAPTDIWFPITMEAQANPGHDYLKDPAVTWLLLMGRLKPGVSLKQADAASQVLGHRIFAELYKGKNSEEGLQNLLRERIEVTPGAKGFSRMRSDFRMPLLTLMGIVGLILLICCANVANLQLARAAARGREMSVRLAVGAGKTRLVRQLLTESFILAIAGGGLGLLFAIWGSHLLLRTISASVPVGLDVHLDATVLIFTAATAILASLLFGLAPAIQATRVDLISALKENKSGQSKAFVRGFGKALLISQIAFSLVLLVAAGWFIRTLQNLEKVDIGYARNGLLLAELDFKTAGYKDSQIDQLVRNLLSRVQQLPGAEAVSASENGLFSGTDSEGVPEVEGFIAHSLDDRRNHYDRVGPNYFSTIRARMIAGREIGPQDNEGAPKVVVINEKMAQFYFPHENPIGKHIFESDDPSGKDKIAVTIVGVVRDVKQSYLRKPAPRRYYPAMLQHRATDPIDALRLEIRTRARSTSLMGAVRRAIKNVDPKLPVTLQTADDLISDEVAQEKLIAKLSSLFGLLAVVLAAIGLYGVLSYLTVRRTTEIGVRMALGARRGVVMAMVVRETFWLIIPGLAIGVVISILLARLLANILFGLSAFDPVSSFSAAIVITIAAALATYLPARRASKIDPMSALRYE
jgi:predicted permease